MAASGEGEWYTAGSRGVSGTRAPTNVFTSANNTIPFDACLCVCVYSDGTNTCILYKCTFAFVIITFNNFNSNYSKIKKKKIKMKNKYVDKKLQEHILSRIILLIIV